MKKAVKRATRPRAKVHRLPTSLLHPAKEIDFSGLFPLDPPLAVGETWFVKLPGSLQIACVEVDELTRRTVVLRMQSDIGQSYANAMAGRYEQHDVKFIERVPSLNSPAEGP